MEYHETIPESDEWYTPHSIFQALGLQFDLDPCSPGGDHWVPARHVYVKKNDGLTSPWFGRVFVNPPFGGRHGHVPWLEKFIDHGNGIAIVRAYTSSGWWHEHMPRVDGICFPKGKTQFIRPNGSVGAQPGSGIALVAMGPVCYTALKDSDLGMFWRVSGEH
jgi:hypothetical protein